ncbi:MAG: hypothetical protein ACE5ER_00760, partial [Nitrospinaceae bacterium]
VFQKFDALVVRFHSHQNHPARDFDIPLKDLASGHPLWTGHPDPEVDLAAIGLDADFLHREKVRYDFFFLDRHALDLQEMEARGVSEGDFVYTLGFPMGIVDADRLDVIARSGIIARVRDALDGRRKDFLIDAFVFPGHSGGPVLYKPEMYSVTGTPAMPLAAMIGIVSGYLTFRDAALSQQTGAPRIIFEENSGLAVVQPVDGVRQTVDQCFQQAKIKERAAGPAPSRPALPLT